ncbi:MAG: hypothetical protein GY821_18105 [Gammaproteobacteria bacterium]|nr:hypothetical protein [Gammaproteobacteria bacterium]
MQPFFKQVKQFYDQVEDNAIGYYLRCLDEYFNCFDRDNLVSLNHPNYKIAYLTRSRQDAINDIRLYICLSPKMEYDTLPGIVKSEVRQSHSIFLRMFFENIQPVTRHYGAPWGAY